MANPLLMLKRKLQAMIARGVVNLVDDSYKRQRMQITLATGEVFSEVERWQQYGHTSVPPKNSENLVVSVGGNRSNLAIVCSEDKSLRLKGLKEGDNALYHLEGHYFKLTEGGIFEAVGKELNITVERVNIVAEKTTVNGEFEVTGNSKFGADVDITGKTTGTGDGVFAGVSTSTHVHPETGTTTKKPS